MPYFRHAHRDNEDGIFIECHPVNYYEEWQEEIETEEKAPEILRLRKRLFAAVVIPAELVAAAVRMEDAHNEWILAMDPTRSDTDYDSWLTAETKLIAARTKWAAILRAYGLDRLHQELCVPDCPWDGKRIF